MDRFVIKIVPSEPGGTSVTGSSTLSADASNQPSAASMNPSTSSDSSHTAKTVKGRQYVPEWKKVFPWIIYDTSRNKVFCDICTTASKSRVVLLTSPYDQLTHSAFVRDGFSQWTKGRERLATHEGSNYHHAAVEGLAAMKKGVNVAASCSVGKTKQMTDARSALIKILSSVQFLCKQGLLCLPPHCSHRLQPLDVGFMKPLMTYYAQNVHMWLRNHLGRVVIMFQIGELFGGAYLRAASVQTAVKAFSTTGISPCNRHVFTDDDYAPESTTDRPMHQNSTENNGQVYLQCL
jgi:hypothetical protein